MRILIIDDDPFVLDLVRRMLKDSHDVLAARSAHEGLDKAHDNPVDMILLDWMMPVIDGISLLSKLKADNATSDIPVIFLSGKTGDVEVRQAIDHGAMDYITKPFKRQDLISKLKRFEESIKV